MGVSPLSAVSQRPVEVELSGVLRLELSRFEFDDDVAQLLYVEEEQVNVEVITTNIEVDLPADEGETRPPSLRVPMMRSMRARLRSFSATSREPQKFKVAGILGDLLDEFRLLRSKLLRNWPACT